MPEQIRIPVKDITANPYQTRFEENAERIASIALSIAQDGLLQPPTVRKAEAHPARPSIPDDAMWYELAFGHTRTAAWKLCNDIQLGKADAGATELAEAVRNSKEDFSKMPVFIAEIDDEKMFRHAVTENAQRADLSPVEEATAMKRAMDDFKYTSEQAGALFGKSGATVRGKVRLLDLPEEARKKLHEGEISESAARGLVTLKRVAPKAVDEALKDILDGDDPEDAIDNALRSAKDITHIYSSDIDVSAKTFNHLPTLNEKDAAKLSDEQKEHLLKPPACTACSLYARADGSDYCAWQACFDRKQASNRIDSLEKASQTLGIAIYQESDGDKMLLNRWDDMHKRHVDKVNADLRLMIVSGHNNGNWGYVLGGLPNHVGIFAVGKLYEKCKKAKTQSAADRGEVTKESTPEQIKKAIEADLNRAVAMDMMDAVTFDIFAAQLEGVLGGVKSLGFLNVLVEAIDNSTNDRANELKHEKRNAVAELKYRRQCVICDLIERETPWMVRNEALVAKQPAAKLAKEIRKMAEKWDVKLGKGFDQAVADADTKINEARKEAIAAALAEKGIVSAETGKGKKK